MSKTNHRINKDREEKDSEAPIHKKRRESKQKLSSIQSFDDLELEDDGYLDDLEVYEPIRKRSK